MNTWFWETIYDKIYIISHTPKFVTIIGYSIPEEKHSISHYNLYQMAAFVNIPRTI